MAEVTEIFGRSRSAQSIWAGLPLQKRVGKILSFREALINHTDDILKLLPSADGQSFPSLMGEVLGSVEQISRSCSIGADAISSHLEKSTSLLAIHQKTLVHYYPFGVILMVGTSPIPLLSTVSRLIPALLAGNAVILSSPNHTGIYLKIVELGLESGLPTGLVQFESRPDGDFSTLIDQEPQKIFCWGPNDFMKTMIVKASEKHVPIGIENLTARIAVVLPDADMDLASSALLSSLSDSMEPLDISEQYFMHERVVDPIIAQIQKKIANLAEEDQKRPRIARFLNRENTQTFKGPDELFALVRTINAPIRATFFSKNLHLAHDFARRLRVQWAFINDQPYAPAQPDLSPLAFCTTQRITLPRTSFFHFKAPWWLPHSQFQFATFRTYLDLYRRHFAARLKAVPMLLWNLLQMFKNERRL